MVKLIKLVKRTYPFLLAAVSAGACGSEKDGSSGGPGDSAGQGNAAGSAGAGGRAPECMPATCAAQSAECGSVDDGCGAMLDCGACTAPLTCGGDGTPNRCSQAYGWTVRDPIGAGFNVNRIWGLDANLLWAAVGGGTLLGGGGQIMMYDGLIWELFYTNASPAFLDVFGLSADDDVFFVGRGSQLIALQDAQFVPHQVGGGVGYRAVWASSPEAVWVGRDNLIDPLALWNGNGWSADGRHTTSIRGGVGAIWGFGPNDVWAVNDEGGVLHFDGQGWTQATTTSPGALTGIHGLSPDDLWAVGPRALTHYDGRSWTRIPAADNLALHGVWVAAPNDVWLVGARGQILRGGASGFRPVPSGTMEDLFTIWGTDARTIWAGGANGTVLQYGPVTTPTMPDPGTPDCKTQGQSCGIGECCAPFRCIRISGDITACG